MLYITIIGLICGGWSILFLISEVSGFLNAVRDARGNILRRVSQCLPAGTRLGLDLMLTLGIVWLFGMSGGQMGMMLSLMASGIVSTWLFFRRGIAGNHNIKKELQ